MPRPFRQLTSDQFFGLLSVFNFTRDIGEVHVHHTWRPDHSQDRGLDSVESMFRYHTQTNGWSDIAQHLTIDGNGRIWTGRSWNRTPASASGHNRGAFMYEMIGDFDLGCDSLLGKQRRIAVTVSAMLLHQFGLTATDVRFHNEFNPKSCPGTSVNQDAFRSEVDEVLRALAGGMSFAPPSRRDQIEFEALIKSFELDEGLPDDPEEAEPDHCGAVGPLAVDNGSQPDVHFDALSYSAPGVSEKQAATSTKVYPGPTDEDAPPQHGVLEVGEAISFSTTQPRSGEEPTEPSATELAYDRALDAIDMPSFSTMDFSSGGVYWPERDKNSTEYAHLSDVAAQTDF